MPSGAILGTCPHCENLIWEDQQTQGIPYEDLTHLWCGRKYNLERSRDDERLSLYLENDALKKRIEQLEGSK